MFVFLLCFPTFQKVEMSSIGFGCLRLFQILPYDQDNFLHFQTPLDDQDRDQDQGAQFLDLLGLGLDLLGLSMDVVGLSPSVQGFSLICWRSVWMCCLQLSLSVLGLSST